MVAIPFNYPVFGASVSIYNRSSAPLEWVKSGEKIYNDTIYEIPILIRVDSLYALPLDQIYSARKKTCFVIENEERS